MLYLGGSGPSAGIIIWEKSSFGSTQIHLFKAFNLSKQKQLEWFLIKKDESGSFGR